MKVSEEFELVLWLTQHQCPLLAIFLDPCSGVNRSCLIECINKGKVIDSHLVGMHSDQVEVQLKSSWSLWGSWSSLVHSITNEVKWTAHVLFGVHMSVVTKCSISV